MIIKGKPIWKKWLTIYLCLCLFIKLLIYLIIITYNYYDIIIFGVSKNAISYALNTKKQGNKVLLVGHNNFKEFHFNKDDELFILNNSINIYYLDYFTLPLNVNNYYILNNYISKSFKTIDWIENIS